MAGGAVGAVGAAAGGAGDGVVGTGVSLAEDGEATSDSVAQGVSDSQNWEIIDGVRRAKVVSSIDPEGTIPARVQTGGQLGPVFDAPVSNLYSPFKDTIGYSTDADIYRFNQVAEGIMNGNSIDPITVQPGSNGPNISDVGFDTD